MFMMLPPLIKRLQPFLLVIAICLGARGAARAVPTTNGVYAGFQTTMGTFYCVLRYDLAPRTVGNFVSLADGSKDWLDYSKATMVKRPFYNGLTFHRVIKGFVIQGGSPNGQGTDDPGYRFRDEILPALTHNRAGILAMANSGTNSNGSQFYITLAPQPSLDGHYTVFGSVVEGLNVVTNIGNVSTDLNDKPLMPVLMTNVFILRIGSAASNFNATAVVPALPVPRLKVSRMQILGPDLLLLWDQLTNYEYRICYSGNLNGWRGFLVGPFAGRYMNDFRGAFPSQFFVVAESKID
jgi:cyclophilin family peptidyl-prolyl cis-trans isomerase